MADKNNKDDTLKETRSLEAIQQENENLRRQLEERDRLIAERNKEDLNNVGMPKGPRPGAQLGDQSQESVTLSIGHSGGRGTGVQVVHDIKQKPVSLAPGEYVDDIDFDSNTAQLLIDRSENGVGHIVVKGHEMKRVNRRPQPTREQINQAEENNRKAGLQAQRENRPASLGSAAGIPPRTNPKTGEANTG